MSNRFILTINQNTFFTGFLQKVIKVHDRAEFPSPVPTKKIWPFSPQKREKGENLLSKNEKPITMNSMPSKWPANLWMKMMTKMKMKTTVNKPQPLRQGIVQWKLNIPRFPSTKPTHVIVTGFRLLPSTGNKFSRLDPRLFTSSSLAAPKKLKYASNLLFNHYHKSLGLESIIVCRRYKMNVCFPSSCSSPCKSCEMHEKMMD